MKKIYNIIACLWLSSPFVFPVSSMTDLNDFEKLLELPSKEDIEKVGDFLVHIGKKLFTLKQQLKNDLENLENIHADIVVIIKPLSPFLKELNNKENNGLKEFIYNKAQNIEGKMINNEFCYIYTLPRLSKKECVCFKKFLDKIQSFHETDL